VAGESAYTVIVTQKLDIKEANLVINSDYGGTDVPVSKRPGDRRRGNTADVLTREGAGAAQSGDPKLHGQPARIPASVS
jgi:hypothetical protein